MERTCNYPIEIKFKIDLNTELLLNELCDLLKKDRSKILRLIIADFFDRNLDLIDKYRKEPNVKNTIGIIITKEQDKFVANYVKSDKLIPLTYEIK